MALLSAIFLGSLTNLRTGSVSVTELSRLLCVGFRSIFISDSLAAPGSGSICLILKSHKLKNSCRKFGAGQLKTKGKKSSQTGLPSIGPTPFLAALL
jgi:hypothetical protein